MYFLISWYDTNSTRVSNEYWSTIDSQYSTVQYNMMLQTTHTAATNVDHRTEIIFSKYIYTGYNQSVSNCFKLFYQIHLYRVSNQFEAVKTWSPWFSHQQHDINSNFIRPLLYHTKIQYQNHINIHNAENEIQGLGFKIRKFKRKIYRNFVIPLIARFMGPTWGPPGADKTQVVPMLAAWILLSGHSMSWFTIGTCKTTN